MGPRRLRTVSFGSSRNKQAIRSNRARALRCKGANASLVEMGFSETSLNRLSCEAVCSQEAMKHHDSSEKDLVAATLNVRLARPFRSQPEVPKDVAQALMTGWTKFVNPSACGRFWRCFIAARTDTSIKTGIVSERRGRGHRLAARTLSTLSG